MAETELKRTASLAGAIAITVGSVIGMSIFVLINSMASLTGPSLPLAFFFALVVASLNAVTVSQLSSAIPRSGGGYVLTSRILGPFWGVATSWFICLAILGALCTVGLGIAKYINLYINPPANEMLITIILVGILILINAIGLFFAEVVQIIIVVLKVLALLMFAVWGYFWGPKAADLATIPFLAGGIGGLALCSVLCYYSYIGFTVIAEVGEEMSNAKRNIPLSVGISAVIIFVVYFSVAITFNRIMGYNPSMLKALGAPLAFAGGLFLPPLAIHFLNLGALGAGVTALNAGIMAMPREIFAQGRDQMVPSVFRYLTKKHRTPLWSVLVVFPLFVALLLFNQSLDWYGFLAVGALLLTNLTIAVACLLLPKRFPERYENAPFKIGKKWLTFFSWAAIVTAVVFLAFIVLQLPKLPLLLALWAAVVIVYYFARKWWMLRRGVDFAGIFKTIPGFEEKK